MKTRLSLAALITITAIVLSGCAGGNDIPSVTLPDPPTRYATGGWTTSVWFYPSETVGWRQLYGTGAGAIMTGDPNWDWDFRAEYRPPAGQATTAGGTLPVGVEILNLITRETISQPNAGKDWRLAAGWWQVFYKIGDDPAEWPYYTIWVDDGRG